MLRFEGAFPCATWCLLSVVEQQVQTDDGQHPNQSGDNSQAVQVLFRHSRTGQVRLHATAEETRKATTFAFVQEHRQPHEKA